MRRPLNALAALMLGTALSAAPGLALASGGLAQRVTEGVEGMAVELAETDLSDSRALKRLRNRLSLMERRVATLRRRDRATAGRLDQRLLQLDADLTYCLSLRVTTGCSARQIALTEQGSRIDQFAARMAQTDLSRRGALPQLQGEILGLAREAAGDRRLEADDKQQLASRITHLKANLQECVALRLTPCSDQTLAARKRSLGLLENGADEQPTPETVAEASPAVAEPAAATPQPTTAAEAPTPEADASVAPAIAQMVLEEQQALAGEAETQDEPGELAEEADQPTDAGLTELSTADPTEIEALPIETPDMEPERLAAAPVALPTPPVRPPAPVQPVMQVSPEDRLEPAEVRKEIERIWQRQDDSPLPDPLPAPEIRSAISADLDIATDHWLKAIAAAYERIEDDLSELELLRLRAPADMDLSELTRLQAWLEQEREPELNYVMLQSLMMWDEKIDAALKLGLDVANLDPLAGDAADRLAPGSDWSKATRRTLSSGLAAARRARLVEDGLGGEPTRDRAAEEATLADTLALLEAKQKLRQAATQGEAEAQPVSDTGE